MTSIKLDSDGNILDGYNRIRAMEEMKDLKEESISVMIFLLNAQLVNYEGGKLTLKYDKGHKFHKESLERSENRIILEVEDNGIGLSDEDMFKGSGISNLKYRANKIEAILT